MEVLMVRELWKSKENNNQSKCVYIHVLIPQIVDSVLNFERCLTFLILAVLCEKGKEYLQGWVCPGKAIVKRVLNKTLPSKNLEQIGEEDDK